VKRDTERFGFYEAVVIGVSAGGLDALKILFSALPADLPVSIFVVQHVSPHSGNYLVKYLSEICPLIVKEADDKEFAAAGTVYIAPPNYHLLVEEDRTLSLTVDERVNYARPSVDVLFDTASDAYGPALVGVILTGANRDGSQGLKKIGENGGLTIVQSPETAFAEEMPRAALAAVNPDYVLPLNEIGPFLSKLLGSSHGR
jgi:two-component system chemotaxis response regulator CheB